MQSLSPQVLRTLRDYVREVFLPSYPSRYFHSLLVRDIALSLRETLDWSVDQSLLIAASECHDMAKYTSLTEGKALFMEYCEPFPENLETYPPCLHGFVAAILLQHRFGLHNMSLLNAIRFHTTGTPHWDSLGLLIYTSDFLASHFARQSTPPFSSLYHLAEEDFYLATLQICELTLQYLQQNHLPIHPLSLEFHTWLLTKQK